MTERGSAVREADVVCRNGSTVHIREASPDDRPKVADFLRGLSVEARASRFFSAAVDVDQAAAAATAVGDDGRIGLLATHGGDGLVVGQALAVPSGHGRAEVAFAVADAWQGLGLGTLLLGQLAAIAGQRGIQCLEATTRTGNRAMIDVFLASGLGVSERHEPGALWFEMSTQITQEALGQFEAREAVAAREAMARILEPTVVAVIGASRHRGSIGAEILWNCVRAGFQGTVVPVNPSARAVQGIQAYPTVGAVPLPVDLAVIAVPAANVVDVARECAACGVRALVVISAGFSEVGEAGRARQHELLGVCRASGMRLVGPNCMGVVNTDPAVNLCATFAPEGPEPGRIAFLSQSGALGLAIIEATRRLGLGLSSFVSVGNKADISGNDCLAYWADDPRTDIIVLYLESFGNPRRFARLARAVGRRKPIVAVKGGRSRSGSRATSSHTGALLAASPVTVDALFRQAGVVRTDTLSELFDVCTVLSTQPLPAGRRVGILSNAGGLAILCADACEAAGLEVPTLDPTVQARLRAFLSAEASVANPVDMVAGAGPKDYGQAIDILGAAPGLDACIVIFIPPLRGQRDPVMEAVLAGARRFPADRPVLTVLPAAPAHAGDGAGRPVASFPYPEEAAHALGRAAEYAAWRRAPEGAVPTVEGADLVAARAVLDAALAEGPRWLSPVEAMALCAAHGLPVPPWRWVAEAAAAPAAAAELGGPVALKAWTPAVIHKTDVGAVDLDLVGARAVTRAARGQHERLHALGHEPEGFLVQRMVAPGVEMIVGMTNDSVFGPVIACGAGGTAVELVHDVAVRLPPLTDRDARGMLAQLAIHPLLEGYRGRPAADVDALERLLHQVSALALAHPAIAELDCNPVMVGPQGVSVVDVRVRVDRPQPELPLSARRPG